MLFIILIPDFRRRQVILNDCCDKWKCVTLVLADCRWSWFFIFRFWWLSHFHYLVVKVSTLIWSNSQCSIGLKFFTVAQPYNGVFNDKALNWASLQGATCSSAEVTIHTYTHSWHIIGSNFRGSVPCSRTLQHTDCRSRGWNNRPSDHWATTIIVKV